MAFVMVRADVAEKSNILPRLGQLLVLLFQLFIFLVQFPLVLRHKSQEGPIDVSVRIRWLLKKTGGAAFELARAIVTKELEAVVARTHASDVVVVNRGIYRAC